MNPRSSNVARALGISDGENTSRRQRAQMTGLPGRAGPVYTKIEDPHADVLDLLDQQDVDELAAQPRMKRQRSRLAQRRSGVWEIDERRCCIDTLLEVQRVLHRIRLPHETVCPECEAKFQIWMGVLDG